MDYEKKQRLIALRDSMKSYGYIDGVEELDSIFPELKESEDDKMRDDIIATINLYYGEPLEEEAKEMIAWLEKQKAKEDLDRMAPIYEDLESFESALEKAWKFYNDGGARTVDSCEDNYIECAFSKGFREGFLYKEKQKEQNPTDAEIKESMDAVTNFKVFAADLAKTFNITHKRDIDWHNFCAGLLTYLERNKPAEWSEEDDVNLGDIKCALYDYYGEERAEELYNWLKSLRPQPKQEWSKEIEAFNAGYKAGYDVGFRDGRRCVSYPYWPPYTSPYTPPYQPITTPVEPYYGYRVTCTTTSDNVQTNNEEHHEKEQ